MALGNLFVSIRASASEWASDVKAIQREGREMEKALKPLQEVAKNIGTAFVAAGAAITGALVVAIKTTADYGDAVNDLSIKSGISTETISKLALAAETSGSSMEGLASGLKLLGKNMEMANSGSKAQIAAFQAAGISAADLAAAHGDVNKILPMLADSFKNAEDGAGKTAVSMALLGRSGSDLIPMLNEGSEGLKKWGDEAQKAGRVVTAEAAAAADEFNDQLRILEVSVMGLSATIANSLIPRLTEWVKEGAKVIQQIKDWTAENKKLADGLAATGVILTGAGGVLLATAALPALIAKVRVAVAALGATVSLATAGLSAALAAIVVFRKEIAMGLMAALATVVKQFEDFFKKMGQVATTLGADGLASKFHEASFSAGTFRRELEATNTMLMLEGMELGKTAGQLAAEEAARTKAAAATAKHRIELEKNVEALSKEKQALQESLKKRMDLDYDYAMGLQMAYAEKRKASELAVQDALRFRMEADYAHAMALQEIHAERRKKSEFAVQDALRQRMELDFEHMESFQRALAHERQEELKKAADEAKRLADIQTRAYEDTFRSVKDTATRAFLDIFKDGEFQFGRLAGVIKGIFRTLATEILSTMTATLITPLVQKLSGALNGILGKVPGLGGIFAGAASAGGSGAGGAIGAGGGMFGGGLGAGGGGLGASAAAFATNPFTIAAAAGIVAAIAITKSQAHHEANTFTKEFQNPFHTMLGNIVDTFDAANAAGKLTKEQAEESLGAVETLWKTFTEQANEFATHGKDEALVVKQAFETLTPLMDRIRTGMQATTDALRPIIPANSGPVTVNLQMDKRTFARLIIPDLYALTRNEGMVLIGAK